MPQIETLARQAWQLREQGYAIDDIADVMGKPTSAIERWICRWPEIAQQTPSWHEGVRNNTVHRLEKAGITSREGLVEAWENGAIQRGKPPGINVTRLVEIQHWLDDREAGVLRTPPRAMIIDLSLEGEAALKHLRRVTGETASQLVSRLLVEADDRDRSG